MYLCVYLNKFHYFIDRNIRLTPARAVTSLWQLCRCNFVTERNISTHCSFMRKRNGCAFHLKRHVKKSFNKPHIDGAINCIDFLLCVVCEVCLWCVEYCLRFSNPKSSSIAQEYIHIWRDI